MSSTAGCHLREKSRRLFILSSFDGSERHWTQDIQAREAKPLKSRGFAGC